MLPVTWGSSRLNKQTSAIALGYGSVKAPRRVCVPLRLRMTHVYIDF